MQESLFSQGFTLLSYGMGTVFVFLTLLILVTVCVSGLMVKFFPEAEPAPAKPRASSKPKSTQVSPKTLKIIQAAIDQHRAKRR